MKTIILPEKFLMVGNSINNSIVCLNKFLSVKNDTIFVNFSNLTSMRKGDLMVLFAQIEKSIFSNKNRIYRKGSFQNNKVIKMHFRNASPIFHNYKEFSNPQLNDAEKEKLVNPVVIDLIVNDLKKIGIKDYYYPFNTFLTELIGNAVEHGLRNKKINWWLTHEINRIDKTVKYTFVDMGIGIVTSHKKSGLPFHYYFFNSKKVVLDSFFGRLISSTKLSNRGRGLPQLKSMVEKGIVSNFNLTTNKVSLNFKSNKFLSTNNSDFVGTYYSWTIDQSNFQKWKNSQ